jgi:hypothetical protein
VSGSDFDFNFDDEHESVDNEAKNDFLPVPTEKVDTTTSVKTSTETTTTTTAKPSTTRELQLDLQSTGKTRSEIPTAFDSSPTSKIEVVITKSIFRLIDEAFRQRLQNFEVRIANLLAQREYTMNEINEFDKRLENEFTEFENLFKPKNDR